MLEEKFYKIYGVNGHRQKQSFGKYERFIFDGYGRFCIVDIYRENETKTNDYVILSISAESGFDFDSELRGQITDGLFENCRVGKIEVAKKHISVIDRFGYDPENFENAENWETFNF